VGSMFKSVRPRAPKKRAPGAKGTTGRWLVLAAVVALAAAFASVASGDVIKNDIAVNGPGQKAIVDPGGTVTVDYFVQQTGVTCDPAVGSSLTVHITPPTGITAAPDQLTFTSCNTDQSVVFTVAGDAVPGTKYTIPPVTADDPDGQYSTGDTQFFIEAGPGPGGGGGGGGPSGPPVNVAPTADAGGPYTGTEGSGVSLDGSNSSDSDGTIAGYSWSYTADTADAGTSCSFDDATSATPTFTCTDDGSFTVSLEVTDDGGLTDSASATVTLDNANPSVSPTNDGPIDEGGSANITANGSDPGSNDTLTYAYDCDNNGSYEDTSGSCSFADNGTYTVGVQATDDDGGTGTGTTDVTVNNVAPSVGDPTLVSTSNCSVSISATFTDPGVLDTHTATINWDPGSSAGTVTESNGSGTVTGSHTYSSPGVHSITVTVTDKDGDSGSSANALSFDNNPVLAYPLPPIIAGKTFKTGSTIPVKVNVTGCTAGLAPTIWYQKDSGTLTAPDPAGKSSKVLGAMRYDTGIPGYIYNWQTKGLAAGTYTIWIQGLPAAAFPYAVVTITK
jgi:PKD domain